MMQKVHLIDTHLSIILLQSFTAFGCFFSGNSSKAFPMNFWKRPGSMA
jgi:ABC-type glycerol-3-phosphate transport system permease component